MLKNVIITGATGQDGSLMADYLLNLNEYNVYGIARHSSNIKSINLTTALKNPNFELICGDKIFRILKSFSSYSILMR